MTELLVALILLLAAVVQGASGFGSGLVAMALLPLVVPLKSAIAVSAVLGIILNSMLAWRLRAHIDRAEVVPLAVAALVGIPFGVVFLHRVEPKLVMATLGAVLVLYSGWSLLARGRPEPVARGWAWLAGLVGGLIGGAFNTAGPPILVYATRQAWPRDVFRANLQTVFVVTGVSGLIGYAMTGMVTSYTLWLDLVGLPVLVVGGIAGQRIGDRVDQHAFRRAVLVALALMGLSYLSRLF